MKTFFIVSPHEVVRNLCCGVEDSIFHEAISIFEKGKKMQVVSAWEVSKQQIAGIWSSASTQDIKSSEFKVAVRREKRNTTFRWASASEWNPSYITKGKREEMLLRFIHKKTKRT
ncbi:MAG: hypothetical protein RLY49_35 [Candidatus Parcubacteria bacterium]|jgi:aromatic ring-opening dioxygenase LigB subunit